MLTYLDKTNDVAEAVRILSDAKSDAVRHHDESAVARGHHPIRSDPGPAPADRAKSGGAPNQKRRRMVCRFTRPCTGSGLPTRPSRSSQSASASTACSTGTRSTRGARGRAGAVLGRAVAGVDPRAWPWRRSRPATLAHRVAEAARAAARIIDSLVPGTGRDDWACQLSCGTKFWSRTSFASVIRIGLRTISPSERDDLVTTAADDPSVDRQLDGRGGGGARASARVPG
jgi:hypothetical protein